MRNRVVHDCGQIDLEIVWEVAHLHLPLVHQALSEWFRANVSDKEPESE
jgi:uncharacterized protein with HEPN domain